MNTTDRIEGESERQLRKWGFELRGSPQLNASHRLFPPRPRRPTHTVWDHEDGRVILLYDDGGWSLVHLTHSTSGRGTASLMTYLRSAG